METMDPSTDMKIKRLKLLECLLYCSDMIHSYDTYSDFGHFINNDLTIFWSYGYTAQFPILVPQSNDQTKSIHPCNEIFLPVYISGLSVVNYKLVHVPNI